MLQLELYSLSLPSLPPLASCLLRTLLSGTHVQRHNATGTLIAVAASLRMEADRSNGAQWRSVGGWIR